jgi:exopolysaccharide production protein ExoQ
MNDKPTPKSNPLIRLTELALTIFTILYFAGINISENYRVLAQGFSLLVYAFVTAVTLIHWKKIIHLFLKDPWFTLFMVFACSSVLWSANGQASWDQTKFLLRVTFFGIYLATRYSTKELLQLLAWSTGFAVVLSFLLYLVLPEFASHPTGQWKGFFQHKQALGAMMGLGASTVLIQTLQQRLSVKWIGFGVYGLALTLAILAVSQTGLLIFLLSLVTLPLYKAIRQRKYRGWLILFVLLGFLSIVAAVFFNLETIVVQGFGKNMEFNGRLPIWSIAIARGLERPWFGYGFYGFWTSDVSDVVIQNVPWVEQTVEFRTRSIIFHSHSGFIELFLQLGGVGLTWFILCFLSCTKRILTLVLNTRSIEYFWMFQFMCIMLLANLTEAWGILTLSLFWVLYVALSFSSAAQCDRLQKASRTAPVPSLSAVT